MRRLISIPLTFAAALLLATTVFAGGWATATLDPGTSPSTGTAGTIGFRVLQHGVTPVSWLTITLVATDQKTGRVVSVATSARGETGHYVATITFPSAGDWTLTWDSKDLMITESSATLTVPAPAAGAATGAATATAAEALSSTLIGLGALVALFVAIVGLAVMRRRSDLPTAPRPG